MNKRIYYYAPQSTYSLPLLGWFKSIWSMSSLDGFILIATLLGIVGYGIWKNRRQENIKSYLRGQSKLVDRRSFGYGPKPVPPPFSTPDKPFTMGWFAQFYFGLPLRSLSSAFFSPIYHKLNVHTAHEFLEERFNCNPHAYRPSFL